MRVSLGARHTFLRSYGVPEGWRPATIGGLATVVGGGTPSRSESRFWNGGTVPWATPSDIVKTKSRDISETAEYITEAGLAESAATLLPVGSILFTSRATIGERAITLVPMATNQGFANLIPRTVQREYLYYLLEVLEPAIKRLAAGTTFTEVSKRDVRTVACALPTDVDEQAAIARILSAVDAAIESAEIGVKRAQVLQQSLLAAAFEEMPADKQRLGEFAVEVRYGTSKAASDRGRGSPTLRIPNVIGDELTLDDLVSVELPQDDVKRLTLRDGDLLLVRTNGNPNYVGRSAVFRPPDDRSWIFASYLIRVRLDDRLSPDYANIYLGTARGRQELLRRVTTSAGNHNINSNSIRLLSIPIPKLEDDQQRVIGIAQTSRDYVRSLRHKVIAYTQLRQSLTHELVTGRLRVGTGQQLETAVKA